MKRFLAILGVMGALSQVQAQDSTQKSLKVVADKIVAQVGDKIILKSDIVNAIADFRRQGQEGQLPPNPECMFLEGQLIQKALVLQAQRDSLTVGEDELEALLDNRIRFFIQNYGGREQLEEIAGKSIYQIKEDFKDPIRENKLAEMVRNKVLEAVKITPTEVRAYFDKIPKDSLPFYESELEISEIVLIPKSNKDVDEYVIREMYEYKRQVENGRQKFENLAKLYSQDPGSRETGGQYQMNRNDKQWDPAFFNAAFRLKEGQISPVIKSKFGFHIIQMVARSGDDAIVRHILRIPAVTDEEITVAKARLDSIRTRVLKGDLTFSNAVNKYSEDEGAKFSGGQRTSRDGSTSITYDQLDKDLIPLLKGMQPGDVSMPQVYTNERDQRCVRIVYLKSRTEPHRENLRDDFNRVAQRALEEKKEAALAKWFKEHIPTFFITIDNDFAQCGNIEDWRKAAAESNMRTTVKQ